MKTKILTLIALLSLSAGAHADKYLCQIAGSDQTLLLEKTATLPTESDEIDSKGIYNLQIQTTELPFPSVNVWGAGTIADTQLDFTANDKTYSVSLFLDDMAGTLYEGNVEKELLDCQIIEKK